MLAVSLVAGLAPLTAAEEASLGDPVTTLRIEAGGLSLLLRDNASSPGVLSGVDSLIHTVDAHDFDAFDPDDRGASAGLNFEHVISGHASPSNAFTPRRGRYTLHPHPGGAGATLVRRAEDDPWGLESTLTYTVGAASAIDFEFRCRARDPALFGRRGYAVLFFADYMNDVAEVPLRFRGVAGPDRPEEWIAADAPPGHADWNQGGTFRHASAPPLEYDADHNFKLNLWSYDYPRFTEPFYFGRAARGMALTLMFDRTVSEEDEIRFSLFKFKVPRRPRPAWDFQYVIRKVEAGKTYGFRGRLVWKRFVSAEDCREEYRRWRASLPPRLPGLGAVVDVRTDAHGIPHVFARSWADAARVLGYLHARDRLWQMDLFRRRASGTLAEILGPAHVDSDLLARQLGFRRSTAALWSSPDFPDALREELLAYAAGVNARLAELGPDGLPPMFRKLGYRPAPWTPIDSLVFSKYMGWDQSGTDTDLWLGRLVEKLGPAALEELWPLDRPYEVPAVKVQAERPKTARAAPLDPVPGAGPAIAAAARHLAAAGWLGRGGSFGSNNWAVDGSRTRSGKPILCSDPHLGFHLPSIWYACHVAVGGRSVAGVTFPVSPVVIIGHNDRIAWGVTNLQADAVDYYIESMKPDDPLQYRHRGEWKRVERFTEEIAVRGEAAHRVEIDSTVHGPIIAREGRAVSLAWTGLGPTRDVIAFWRLHRAADLGESLVALDDLAVPSLNVVYADVDGHIALHPCGALPLRTPGQGRIPMDGASGDHDWAGTIPRRELPLALDPAEGFVASANGRPATIGYPHYLGWMWDPSYRVRRIHELLGAASELTLETMAPLQNDAYDKLAERFLPPLLESLGRVAPASDLERRALEAVRAWDRIGRGDTIAPVVWLEWLERYRDAVWDDEWRARGIEKERGSWGFSGDNRREPALEVLEYITREHPRSAWLDDQATPQREGRDEIAARAFHEAVAALEKRLGADTASWAWSRVNLLRVASITGDPALDRGAVPVPGTAFTVNPGGDGGRVTSGASCRFLIDFGDPTRSVCVFPGGQSDDPSSAQYDDQIPLWAAGQYVPLQAVSEPGKLDLATQARATRFVP